MHLEQAAKNVATAIERLTYLDEGSIVLSVGIAGDFTMTIHDADLLSIEQMRGLEELGEKFGAGKPNIMPTDDCPIGNIQFLGQANDLKPDIAQSSLTEAQGATRPVTTWAAKHNPRPKM